MNEHLWKQTDEEWVAALAAISAHDLGWAAGFFDGEGCVTAGRRKRPANRSAWFHVKVAVSNTNREALERFQALFRGTIYTRQRIPGRRQAYVLYIEGKLCERCLSALAPHVTVKREQVAAALEMRALLAANDPRRRGGVPRDIYDRLGALVERIRAANGVAHQVPVAVPDDYVEV